MYVAMKRGLSLFIFFAALAGIFCSCTKDTVTLIANISQSNGSKAFIDNRYACWSNGDQVRINGGTYTVAVTTPTASTQSATISGVAKNNDGYYAFYPGTSDYLTGSTFGNGSNITLPSNLSYVYEGGHQIIKAPMAAKADADNVLKFQCLTTILQINIPAGNAILSKITIQSLTSAKYLAGTAQVTFSGTTPTLGAIDGDSPHSDMIEMTFGDGVSVASGLSVFIPIPVCENGTVLRIKTFNKSNLKNAVDITVNNQTGSGFPANTIIPVNGPEVEGLEGYELKNWICSQGSGYIDLGIPPTNDAKFEIEFMITSDQAASSAQYLTGSRYNNNGLQYFTLTGNTNSPHQFRGTFMGEYKVLSRWYRESGVRYRESMEVKLSYGSETAYRGYLTFQKYDGASWLTHTDSTRAVEGGISNTGAAAAAAGIPSDAPIPNILVFATRPNTANSHSGMKLYHYRIWINGTLQHDFIPCQRMADGSVGVYDMVGTNGFLEPYHFPSAPAFTVGND